MSQIPATVSNTTVYYDICSSDAEFAAMEGYRQAQGCTLLSAFRQPRALFTEVHDVSAAGLQGSVIGDYSGTIFVLVSSKP